MFPAQPPILAIDAALDLADAADLAAVNGAGVDHVAADGAHDASTVAVTIDDAGYRAGLPVHHTGAVARLAIDHASLVDRCRAIDDAGHRSRIVPVGRIRVGRVAVGRIIVGDGIAAVPVAIGRVAISGITVTIAGIGIGRTGRGAQKPAEHHTPHNAGSNRAAVVPAAMPVATPTLGLSRSDAPDSDDGSTRQ